MPRPTQRFHVTSDAATSRQQLKESAWKHSLSQADTRSARRARHISVA